MLRCRKMGKPNAGLSIIVLKDQTTIYPAEFEIFQKIILQRSTEGLSDKYNTVSEGFNSRCSICLEVKEHLHGFASPFKYYTVDKQGFISNYFNVKLAWKNYPICDECAENLYLGARLIEEELRFRFCGRSYMAVPRLLIEDVENYQIVYEAFSEFKAIDKNKQSTYEDEFMTYMAEQKNHFTLDMIFFEEDAKSKAIQLKSHIEEIFPSRFKKIFVEAREAVDNHPTFAKHLIFEETIFEKETGKKIEKKEIFSQKFRFGKLLQFFDKGNYSIIQVVFDGSPIDKTLLYSKFMEFYRNNYQKSTKLNKISTLRKPIIDAISVINYLAYLKLISIEPLNYEVIMDSENESVKKEGKFDLEKLQTFVKDNPEFFDQKYKVGVFCLGVLVQMVMNIQNANLGSTPFIKKLKGFQLSAKDVENVYVEALAKLQQYQGNYAYGNLRKFMTQYFNLEMPAIKKAATAEISFYFVTGMESQFVFKTLTQTGENDE
jgi:CRISPR-associated protein Csh1